MKKIIFLTDSVITFGGIQRCVCQTANKLNNLNYEISIICTNHDNKNNNIFNLNRNVKVYYSKQVTNINRIVFGFTKIIEYMNKNLGMFKKSIKINSFIHGSSRYSRNNDIIRIINNINPDYIIGTGGIYTIFLGIYAKKIKAKKIGWQHSSCDAYFNHNFKNQKYLFKHCINQLDEYVVLTEHDKNWIKNNFDYNAKCIYNLKSFTSDKVSNLKEQRMISVGRLVDAKNYELLINAFEIFHQNNKDWHLDIFGDGIKKAELKELIKQKKLEKYITIKPPTDNIIDEYLKSSLFIICSKFEGFPMVVLEALECGLPIITSDLPCFYEMISDKEGIIISKNEAKYLADAIFKIVDNRDILQKYAKNSKIRSNYFSDDKIIKKWLQILK